jgi:hypothetical protein
MRGEREQRGDVGVSRGGDGGVGGCKGTATVSRLVAASA